MKKAKAAKSKNEGANLNKQFMLSAAKCIVEIIVTEKMKQNGRVPRGYASKLLSEGRKTFPGMSRRTINNYVILLEKERKIGLSILVESCSNNISSLTDPESNYSNDVALLGVTDPETTDLDGTVASDPSNIDDASAYSNNNSDAENERLFTLGGCPKGSTNASALDLQNRIEATMEDAVSELEKVQASAKVANERLKKGALTEIISDCKKKHGLGENTSINEGSIRQRLKRNTLSGIKGMKSPMAAIEPYIVSLIIQLANMRVPITAKQGLQLCNSIINGTKFEGYVTDFQMKNLRSVTKKLGSGYW
jgi:hypothetical protein